MRIDIWTDFICPWCYLGKRRLELALERFEGRGAVELHWRSFQLDPEFPLNFEGGVNDLLVGKYGMSRSEAESIHARVTRLGAEDGLVYRFERCRPSNTFDAHRLLQAALGRGLGAALQDRLMRAYFSEGASLAERSELIAYGVGEHRVRRRGRSRSTPRPGARLPRRASVFVRREGSNFRSAEPGYLARRAATCRARELLA